MSSASKLAYEKPSIEFWSTEALDSIEATMSGGGGGGGGGGIKLKWTTNWVVKSSNEEVPLLAGAAISAITAIATDGLGLATGGSAALSAAVSLITGYLLDKKLSTVWYTRRIRHLEMLSGYTSRGSVWDYVGQVVITDFYSNKTRTKLIERTTWNNLPESAKYMMNYL